MKNNKKKIIFVSQALWIGGIETALVNLINKLDYNKYDVTCLITQNYLDVAERLTKNCRLIVADRHRLVTFTKPYRFKKLYSILEEPQGATRFRRFIWRVLNILFKALENHLYSGYIKEQLKGESFDTAIIYSDRTAEIAVKAINAKKFLMFYHHGAMRKEYHDRYGYEKSEKIIAVSDNIAKKLKSYRKKYANKIVTVNNVIDIDSIIEKSKEPIEDGLFPENNFNIVSCGRLAKEKGFDLAVEACRLLVENNQKNINWIFVGDGPERENIEKQIILYGLENYINLIGMKKNPYPYIARADLYVQPSRVESFGLTITEAMVLGIPVLSTETDGAKEVFAIKSNGILCKVSGEDIFKGIQKLKKERQTYSDASFVFREKNINIIELLEKMF